MTEHLTAAALVDRLVAEQEHTRRIVAIAGSPGSGKSTLSEYLKSRINARRPGSADILMMDGFHFDDTILNARGHRARKGAPHTFDVDGFRAVLERLRLDSHRDVAVPVFDRTIEIARAGARILEASTRIILAEGNYLLLNEPDWRTLAPLFDVTVMVEASRDDLVRRLTGRWEGFGYEPAAIRAKLEGNDLINMRLVIERSRPADIVVQSDSASVAQSS